MNTEMNADNCRSIVIYTRHRGVGSEADCQDQERRVKAALTKMGIPAEQAVVLHDYAGTTDKRPGFERLQTMLQAGQVDIVAVEDADRLSRDFVTIDDLERDLASRGGRLVLAHEGPRRQLAEIREHFGKLRKAIRSGVFSAETARKEIHDMQQRLEGLSRMVEQTGGQHEE